MGTGNFFLVKYNSAGNVVWAKAGSCVSDIRGSGLSVDVHGNIYATGFLLAPATFGTLTLSNAGVFVVKYNSSGTALWVKGGSVSGLYNSHAVATDRLGNVYATGSFRNTNMTFGSTTLINAGSYDFYLVKYDSSGTQQWAIREGGSGDEEGFDIATDTSNNLYLTGYYFESTGLILGSFTLTNTGAENMLLVKYNSSGNVIWAKSAGGINTTNGYGVSISTEQGVYVSGKLNSAIMFGSLPLSLPVGQCHSTCDPMFIVKYDTSGNALCASGLASGGDDYNDVATDAFGNAYIGADFLASPFIVGNDTLTLVNPNSGITSENIFVAKWTANCQQTGIEKLNNIEQVNIYPNPTSDQFFVDANPTDKLNVDLYDVNGRHVFSASVNDKSNINIATLDNGIYSLTIKTADRVINKKLIILR